MTPPEPTGEARASDGARMRARELHSQIRDNRSPHFYECSACDILALALDAFRAQGVDEKNANEIRMAHGWALSIQRIASLEAELARVREAHQDLIVAHANVVDELCEARDRLSRLSPERLREVADKIAILDRNSFDGVLIVLQRQFGEEGR